MAGSAWVGVALGNKAALAIRHLATEAVIDKLLLVTDSTTVCNGGAIAAQSGHPDTDNIPLETPRSHCPDRDVVTLNVDAPGEVDGGIQ